MKMTFLINHTKQKLFGRSFFKILIIFLLILIFVFTFSFSNTARSLTLNTLSPLFSAGDYFYKNLDQIPKFFSDRNKLIEENAGLSSELENLRLNIADYESIKSENQMLREDFKLKPAESFTAASVIAKSPQIPLDSLFLDKGTADGLNSGDLILAGERILIGKIVKVSKNRATAALNSFAGVTTYGYVSRTNEPIEVSGVGGGGIEAKMPIDFDIVVGDKIMTGGSLQFLAAVVGSIEEDKSSGFKNILMSLPVDISKINIVFISPLIIQ
jgi:cell shape-determining protein MreC